MSNAADRRVVLLRGRYELLETLGSGGEARVVKALDRQHARPVALKLRRVTSERGRDDLLREARVLLGLAPHAALPLVREDFFEGDEYVIVMDWVDGTDLARLLWDKGTPGLALSSVLTYLAEAAEALTFLHTHDPPIIHGDVKPANLILTRGGCVKLVDFGLSCTLGMEGQRSGTAGFQAPELQSGRTAFARERRLRARGDRVRAARLARRRRMHRRALGRARRPPGGALGGGDQGRSRCRSGEPAGDARRACRASAGGLGLDAADRGGDVLDVRRRGLHRAVGGPSGDDGGVARPSRRADRRHRRSPRRPFREVNGRRRLDDVGVRIGGAGRSGRRSTQRAPSPARRGPTTLRSGLASGCTPARLRSVAATTSARP